MFECRTSKNGTGPTPKAKHPIIETAEKADSVPRERTIPIPSDREDTVIPHKEERRRILRPNRSISCAEIKVTARLTTEIETLIQAARSGRRVERIEVE